MDCFSSSKSSVSSCGGSLYPQSPQKNSLEFSVMEITNPGRQASQASHDQAKRATKTKNSPPQGEQLKHSLPFFFPLVMGQCSPYASTLFLPLPRPKSLRTNHLWPPFGLRTPKPRVLASHSLRLHSLSPKSGPGSSYSRKPTQH